MTSLTNHTPTTTDRIRRSRVAQIGLWVLLAALVAQFVAGGMWKLTANSTMVTMFDDIGAGDGLRLFVGVCEVAGGIGLLIPRVARLATAGLIATMIGAAVTNVVVLDTNPTVPIVLVSALITITIARKENAR